MSYWREMDDYCKEKNHSHSSDCLKLVEDACKNFSPTEEYGTSQRRDIPKAIGLMKLAIERTEDCANLEACLANMCLYGNKYEEAKTHALKAKYLDSDHLPGRVTLVQAYRKTSNTKWMSEASKIWVMNEHQQYSAEEVEKLLELEKWLLLEDIPNGRFGPYLVIRCLSRGNTGVVAESEMTDGTNVAIKYTMHTSSLIKEAARLERLSKECVNVVPHFYTQGYGRRQDPRYYYIIIERMSVSFGEIVRQLPELRMSEKAVAVSGYRLLQAVEIINNFYIHGDLDNVNNVMLDITKSTLKIVDFDAASPAEERMFFLDTMGVITFMHTLIKGVNSRDSDNLLTARHPMVKEVEKYVRTLEGPGGVVLSGSAARKPDYRRMRYLIAKYSMEHGEKMTGYFEAEREIPFFLDFNIKEFATLVSDVEMRRAQESRGMNYARNNPGAHYY